MRMEEINDRECEIGSVLVSWNTCTTIYCKVLSYTALLCQKEASDIPSKSELLMFSYCIPSVLFFQAKSYA